MLTKTDSKQSRLKETSIFSISEFKHFFSALFAYFDETKCRWETEKDSCDDYFTDLDVTFSSNNNSETHVEDSSDTDTNKVDETSSSNDMDITDTIDADSTAKETYEYTHADTDPDSGVTNVTTVKPFYQNLECEPLDKTWMCSSGSKNNSLCIKFCTKGLDSPPYSFV